MGMSEFQDFLVKMALNPQLVDQIKTSKTVAAENLSPLETRRLLRVAEQPGMALACTLARANRLGPIVDSFPFTCALLKPRLREILDRMWLLHLPDSIQLTGEEELFVQFIQKNLIPNGELKIVEEDVFNYERISLSLVKEFRHCDLALLSPRPFRFASFRNNPFDILEALENGRSIPDGLDTGHFLVRITLESESLNVTLES